MKKDSRDRIIYFIQRYFWRFVVTVAFIVLFNGKGHAQAKDSLSKDDSVLLKAYNMAMFNTYQKMFDYTYLNLTLPTNKHKELMDFFNKLLSEAFFQILADRKKIK